jgi:hypothetical protein
MHAGIVDTDSKNPIPSVVLRASPSPSSKPKPSRKRKPPFDWDDERDHFLLETVLEHHPLSACAAIYQFHAVLKSMKEVDDAYHR